MPEIPFFLVTRCLILCTIGYYMLAFPNWLAPQLRFAGALTPLVGGLLVGTASLRLLVQAGLESWLLDALLGLELLSLAVPTVLSLVPGGYAFLSLALMTFWSLVENRVVGRDPR